MIVHGRERNAILFKSLLLTVAAIILLSSHVVGQLKQFPLPVNGASKSSKTQSTSARSQELQPRKLPFWEDFSATPVGVAGNKKSNYPVDSLWVNNKTIWINNGIGINPPSLNVATFDGLDSAFLPYSNQVLPNGFRDSLVSQPINMGEADVTLAERTSVYLSFFYQWEGNGEAPDATDYLLVEFKNSLQKWEPVMTIFPKASFSRSVFYDTLIKVEGDQFFHDSFQFRFKNYGRLSGPYDTWNVDYIYLNKNRSVTDTDFPDQAISSTLTSLFNKYQSIPYDHFLNSSAIQSPTFDVFNGLNDFTDLTYLTEATFLNYDSGLVTETFISNLGVNDTSAINDDGSGIIFPLEKRTVTMQYVPSASASDQFDPKSDSVWVKLKVKLFTGDTFDPKTSGLANDYDLNYLPIDFRANDTISANYFLNDYYAYDDGVAEYAAGLTQAGNRAAVLFEMLTSEPDTLVGIDIYVPDYGLSSNLTTDFYIYNDKDGLPGDVLYAIPSVSVQRKGLNVFQGIRIGEPFLVTSKFYVGWRAPVGGVLKLGLDYNNDAGDKIYVNTNGSWVNNDDINGSLMIRPVFGSGKIILGVPEEESIVGVFPNPNHGEFNITGDFDKLYIVNSTGQEVPFQLQSNGSSHKVNLQHPASGLYLIKMQQGNKLRSAKIIVK